jgi:hypothetical protein
MNRRGLEEIDVRGDEFSHHHQWPPRNTTDNLVCFCEDAVLIVLRHGTQMLNQEGGHCARALQGLAIGLDRDRFIGRRPANNFTHRLGNAGLIHLGRPEQWIDFALMRCWISKDCGDEARLVFRGYWRVAPIAERLADDAPFYDMLSVVGIGEPFREKGRTYVCSRYAGPIKYTLGDPLITRGVAFRIFARRNLRHVHHPVEPSFLRRLREIGRGVDQTRTDGIDKIRTVHARRRPAHSVKIEQIADDHFCAKVSQPVGPLVRLMHKRSHRKALVDQRSMV